MSLGGARIVEHRRVQRAPPPPPLTAPPPPPSTRPEPKANPGTRTDTHDRVSHRPRRPSRLHHLRVNGRPHHIGVGRTHARTRVLILVHDLNTRIINATNGELLRDFTLDPTNDYQPTGAPKGGFDRAAHASATDVDRHRYLAQSVTQRGLA